MEDEEEYLRTLFDAMNQATARIAEAQQASATFVTVAAPWDRWLQNQPSVRGSLSSLSSLSSEAQFRSTIRASTVVRDTFPIEPSASDYTYSAFEFGEGLRSREGRLEGGSTLQSWEASGLRRL